MQNKTKCLLNHLRLEYGMLPMGFSWAAILVWPFWVGTYCVRYRDEE